MARRAGESLAAYYRRHGEEMRLAGELGCTPIEAGRELARRKAAEAGQRLQARMTTQLRPGLSEVTERKFQWWQGLD